MPQCGDRVKLSNKTMLHRDFCFPMIFIVCEPLGVGFFLCAVQAQLGKTIVWLMVWPLNTVIKHRRVTWSFYYRETARRFPAGLPANSKEGTIEGRYEFLRSSGFSLHLGSIFNVPIMVFDSQYSLWLYISIFFGCTWIDYFLCMLASFLRMTCVAIS